MAELPTITAVDLLAFQPCYYGQRLQYLIEIAETKAQWNALEILDCEHFPLVDRFWLLFRREVIPAPLLHEAACRVLEMFFSKLRSSGFELDSGFQKVLDTKRAWIRKEVGDSALSACRTWVDTLPIVGCSEYYTTVSRNACYWLCSLDAVCAIREVIAATIHHSQMSRVAVANVLRQLLEVELSK